MNISKIILPKNSPDRIEKKSVAKTNQKKSNSSLPDEVIKNIRKMAKEDAQKNIYMDTKYISYICDYEKKHISPDRSKLQRMLTPVVMNARYTNGKASFFDILGFPSYKGKLHVGSMTTYMVIYDNNGEEILSYSSPPNGGWISSPTKAETNFHTATTAIYYEAYCAARDEIAAQSELNKEMTPEFDMRA